MKSTKIVCTIGPASDSIETLKELMKSGMNVCRLNFSHGNHDEHLIRINNIKEARKELDLPIGIMLDTKGPEIRLGEFGVDQVQLSLGDTFTLTTEDIIGDQNRSSISYKGLPQDVKVGGDILIDDGLVAFKIKDITETDIVMEAQNYGILKSKKGVNVPNANIQLPSLTEKDISDIKFGIGNGVNFIAASFIRKAEDVLDIRKILEDNNGSNIQIISKIESQEGVDNLDAIIEVSDGIMVARGDLGVEIRTETMPIVQKEMIRKTSFAGKPVITATQMLDSMTRNPRPTRAEVTDVANAILDGTDAVMLSGETAAGNYPVEAVKVMHNIAITTEGSTEYTDRMEKRLKWHVASTTNAISRSTKEIVDELNAEAIISATASGATAKVVSKFRPQAPIIATTTTEEVMNSLTLVWGVHPLLTSWSKDTDEVIDNSISVALEKGFIKQGDLIVITAGLPVGVKGTTNLIKVHTVGKIRAKGMGIGTHSTVGIVRKGNTPEELIDFQEGDILVAQSTDADIVPFFQMASGVIVEEGGLTSHAAIVGLHLKIPTLVGVENAMEIFENGEMITIDPAAGIVYSGEARVI